MQDSFNFLFCQVSVVSVIGQISIALDAQWYEPCDSSDLSHMAAAERSLQFWVGWFAHPIFVNGDYPQVMKDVLQERLPTLSDEDQLKIKGKDPLYPTSFKVSC